MQPPVELVGESPVVAAVWRPAEQSAWRDWVVLGRPQGLALAEIEWVVLVQTVLAAVAGPASARPRW